MKVNWIVDQYYIDHSIYFDQNIKQIIKNNNHNAYIVDMKEKDFDKFDVDSSIPTILLGTIEFVKYFYKFESFQPGAIGYSSDINVEKYMSNIPLELFLNSEAVFMTWSMFKQSYCGSEVFIRPLSGFKTFTGQSVNKTNFDDHVSTLEQISGVMNDTMILVSPSKKINAEYRFVISDNKVITGSEYRWDNKLDVRRDYPDECLKLAKKVAKLQWQPDFSYTCDIAMTDNGPFIVELNSFSSSGFYACDLDKIVKKVSLSAINWFNDI